MIREFSDSCFIHIEKARTELGSDAADRRLKAVEGRRLALLSDDWGSRCQQTEGHEGKEERGDTSEQHCGRARK